MNEDGGNRDESGDGVDYFSSPRKEKDDTTSRDTTLEKKLKDLLVALRLNGSDEWEGKPQTIPLETLMTENASSSSAPNQVTLGPRMDPVETSTTTGAIGKEDTLDDLMQTYIKNLRQLREKEKPVSSSLSSKDAMNVSHELDGHPSTDHECGVLWNPEKREGEGVQTYDTAVKQETVTNLSTNGSTENEMDLGDITMALKKLLDTTCLPQGETEKKPPA